MHCRLSYASLSTITENNVLNYYIYPIPVNKAYSDFIVLRSVNSCKRKHFKWDIKFIFSIYIAVYFDLAPPEPCRSIKFKVQLVCKINTIKIFFGFENNIENKLKNK